MVKIQCSDNEVSLVIKGVYVVSVIGGKPRQVAVVHEDGKIRNLDSLETQMILRALDMYE